MTLLHLRRSPSSTDGAGRHAIRRGLCRLGLSQQAAAERYGVPLRTLGTWLSGSASTRSADLLLAIQADLAELKQEKKAA